jgi:tripartite-type tricarboxylate transporter receptor subunit TctC
MMALATAAASAQDFPARPVRIVTDAAGSGNDFAARLFADGLTTVLGQRVIVENRPSGVIPREVVANATPDGHTLLLAASALWIAPLLQKTPYDPVKDFSPISLTSGTPNILVVHPSLPVNSVKDLIDLARKRPGQLNYSSGSLGSTPFLAAELFKSMTGAEIVRVSYSSASIRMTSLVSGEVQLEFATGGSIAPYLKSGRLKALAVTSAKPSPLVPGLPAIAETVPGYESIGVTGLLAPAKTPDATIRKLNQAIIQVLNRPEVKGRLADAGVETIGTSPEEFATRIRVEMERWRKIFTTTGMLHK